MRDRLTPFVLAVFFAFRMTASSSRRVSFVVMSAPSLHDVHIIIYCTSSVKLLCLNTNYRHISSKLATNVTKYLNNKKGRGNFSPALGVPYIPAPALSSLGQAPAGIQAYRASLGPLFYGGDGPG